MNSDGGILCEISDQSKDEEVDWSAYQKNGVLAYIQRLREQRGWVFLL
ncbi:hypothetical protein [Ruminococcus gauvreauii]|uniref:Uncharacterized protein n=1 Tax=Ruminococcus gauvreauii TaxID=438033 RepID=A0ABY5VDF9_9FIRM|nr:hypothetical protein [Ruminococcus gauvreauii]UWP58332.1 hypothetical protein NQ502_13190 [Ruminococcus gauvreauii]